MSTWYIVRKPEPGERASTALALDGSTTAEYGCPQWTECSWRESWNRRTQATAFASAEAAREGLKRARTIRWRYEVSYDDAIVLRYVDAIVLRVYTREESRARAEARGEVRALEAVRFYQDEGAFGILPEQIEALLQDAMRRSGAAKPGGGR